MSREQVASPQDAREAIRAWTTRKERMFTERHVEVAWQALGEAGLLPVPVNA